MTNKTPNHLSAAAKKLWRAVNDSYELGVESTIVLETALLNWDRAEQARRILKTDGITIGSGDKTRRHPAIDIEKQAYSLFLRAWRQLALDIDPPGPNGRPAGGRR